MHICTPILNSDSNFQVLHSGNLYRMEEGGRGRSSPPACPPRISMGPRHVELEHRDQKFAWQTVRAYLSAHTVLGQKDSSDAHFTPKVADFATLPLATIFIRIHKNFAVY